MHNQPVTSVPGSAPRGAHPSGAANATTPPRGPTRCPLRPPDFPGTATRAQPWTPEPLAGNDNQYAQLSAVTINANTNPDNPTTPAVLFHLDTYIPQGVPDTFGFNGTDSSQRTGDTVASGRSRRDPARDPVAADFGGAQCAGRTDDVEGAAVRTYGATNSLGLGSVSSAPATPAPAVVQLGPVGRP